MAYNETYTSTDAPAVVIDLLVTVIAVAVGFGGLIGLIILLRWAKGKKVM